MDDAQSANEYNDCKKITNDKNPTDYMSRNPITMEGTRSHQKMADDYLNLIAPSSIPRARKIEDVKRATGADDMMQSVITLCRSGCWFEIHKSGDPMMREFYNVRKQLTVTDDNILLRGQT